MVVIDEELLKDWQPARVDPAALAVRVWRKCLRFMDVKGVCQNEENSFWLWVRGEKLEMRWYPHYYA